MKKGKNSNLANSSLFAYVTLLNCVFLFPINKKKNSVPARLLFGEILTEENMHFLFVRFVYLLYFAFWYMYTTTCDTLQHKYLWKKIARCKLQVLEAEWLIISSTASFMNRNLHFEFIPMEQNTSDTEKWISMDLKLPVFPNGNWIGNHK